MKVYDESGALVESPDLSKGWVETQWRVTKHHSAVPYKPAVTHVEFVEGTDGLRKLVEDYPEVPEREAYDDLEQIEVYHMYTPEELESLNKPTEIEQLRADVDFLAAMGGVQL